MTKATIKLEDTLVKDSLLVTNTEAGEKEINIDDLISGPVYEEIIIDKSIFNSNNNENNNTKDENKTKKDLKNSSIALYNKLKRSKITFLEGEHDFDLIFKDEKIEDFDIASNLNKNNETNLTEISEHITLEEKLATSKKWDEIKVLTLNGMTQCFHNFKNILIFLGDSFEKAWTEYLNFLIRWNKLPLKFLIILKMTMTLIHPLIL